MVLGGRPPGRVGRRRIYSLNNPRFLTESGVVLVYGVITFALASLARLCLNAARAILVAPTAVVDHVAAVIPRDRAVAEEVHAATMIVMSVVRVVMMTGVLVGRVVMVIGLGVVVLIVMSVVRVVMMTGVLVGRVVMMIALGVVSAVMTIARHVVADSTATTPALRRNDVLMKSVRALGGGAQLGRCRARRIANVKNGSTKDQRGRLDAQPAFGRKGRVAHRKVVARKCGRLILWSRSSNVRLAHAPLCVL